MTTIDAHLHVLAPEWIPESVRLAWARAAAAQRGSADGESLLPRVMQRYADPDGTVTMAALDRCGVAAGIAQIVDWTRLTTSTSGHVPIDQLHEIHEEIAMRFDGRFFYSAGIDPRHPEARTLLDSALERPHCVGIKLYPAAGWDLDSPAYDYVFERAAEYAMPIVIHTSPLGGDPLVTERSRPARLAGRMRRHTSTTFVMAHAGFEAWWLEAADIASGFGNAVVDISLWSSLADRDHGAFRSRMRTLVEKLSPHRIIFGSDQFRGARHDPEGVLLDRWIDQCRSLTESYRGQGPVMDADGLDALMWANGARVFGLEVNDTNEVTTTRRLS